MDNGTDFIALSSQDLLISFNDTFIWDNKSSHGVVVSFNKTKYSFFLIGITFLGGFLAGFLLQCLYAFILKICVPEEEEHSGGLHNLAYVEDESRPPPNDHPPDYDSVMSGAVADDLSRNRQSIRKILWRFLKKKTESETVQPSTEELPPSYSSVVANLHADLNENQ